jgi:RNA polymerase sigma-70 factor (ECF subfamily)
MVEAPLDESLSDEDLLVRIGNQDRRAFTILMHRHGERVRGLAFAFSGRAAETDDIVQDVFVTLWRRPQAWKPGQAAFSTWLYRVVANRCLDYARRRRLRALLPLADVSDPADDAPTALHAVAARDHLVAVSRLIRTLPEKQRLAVLLAAQGEHATAEIATILRVSEGAAEQLLVRARRKLRTMMKEKETVS